MPNEAQQTSTTESIAQEIVDDLKQFRLIANDLGISTPLKEAK